MQGALHGIKLIPEASLRRTLNRVSAGGEQIIPLLPELSAYPHPGADSHGNFCLEHEQPPGKCWAAVKLHFLKDYDGEWRKSLNFHEFGPRTAPHVMLIHGGGNAWWNYLRQARALSPRYHVILPTCLFAGRMSG